MFKTDKYEEYQTTEEKAAKKSKMRKMLIAIITIILIIVLVVVLCVVFLVILKSDDGNNNTIYPGYKLKSVIRNDSQAFEAQLQFLGSEDYYVNNKYSPFIKNLNFSATYDSNDELTLKFIDANQSRFTLPYSAPFPYTKAGLKATTDGQTYAVVMQNNPFTLKVIRKATNETIFDFADLPFVYSDRYLEFSTFLPTKYIYGLGERRQNFSYQAGTYTIWPKDQYAEMDNGAGPNHQTYGSHPMYLMREKSQNFHVVFLRNSNAMDFIISNGFKVLTYKITGGIIELKFFLGGNQPEQVLKLYHQYINGYALMPFWSLGYHQSRWGYNSSSRLLEVVNKFSNFDIPLDTIWSDIDYMDKYRDFTIGSNFKLADFEAIFNKSVHWVPILDLGIDKSMDNTSAYQKANQSDIFIKSFFTEEPLLACVWPGLVSFPDFNHPNASNFWGSQLGSLYQQISFSGIWLDMNEPSNFIEGETLNGSMACGLPTGTATNMIVEEKPARRLLEKTNDTSNDNNDKNDKLHATDTKYIFSQNLPYLPGNVLLENKTISMNATHYYQGVYLSSLEVITELDFHSLNGFLESKTTYDYLKQNLSQPLPFVLSRSNMFGSGAFSFHWTGDNYADWSFLQSSISEIFNFQLFGIPLTGVDLCGFAGNTTEELCTRFMQVGALYPFSRNHNSIDAIDQEPYAWGVNSSVFKASRSSLKLRYSLLKWYYSLFVRNNGSGTVFRPLFFEFPDDIFLLELNDHFMLGSDLLVAPVLKANQTTNWVYFVNNTSWFDFFNGSLHYEEASMFVEVPAPLDSTPPIFIRAGSIVPIQNTTNVTTVKDLSNQFKLKIAFDSNLTARGEILGINDYTNDTNVVSSCTGSNNCIIDITATALQINDFQINLTVNFKKRDQNTVLQEIYITEVEFFGLMNENMYTTLNYSLNSSFLVQDNANISLYQVFNSFYKLASSNFDGQRFTGNLIYQGSDAYYQGNILCPIVKNISLLITYDSLDELSVIFDDATNPRFALPRNKPFPYTKSSSFSGNQNYYFAIPTTGDRFGLQIIRNSTKEVIFDTTKYLFMYSDHYLELSTALPTQYLYGLGERRQGFLYKKDSVYTIWPKDQYVMMDDGAGPNHQTYGQHPVYLMREASGYYNVVFLRNNHAMDIQISGGVSKLSYKTVGGIFEFKMFLGDQKPDTVLKAYHSYLNGYTMMPFWSLGYHQSRWGYSSSQMMLEVVQNFSKYDIPLDTIWSDIDYMDNFEDFTIGSKFNRTDFDQIRNQYSVNWVPIIDIGIATGADNNNSAYIQGLSMNVYVNSSITNKPLMNCVWPGKVSYPDFNNPNASIFWKQQLQNLYTIVPFDGLWLDMNEPSAFYDSELPLNTECPPLPMPDPNARLLVETPISQSFFNSAQLPYIPGLLPLENKTMSMNATHMSNGSYVSVEGNFTEFDFHGLSGYLESLVTYEFLNGNLKQVLPFILSRSTLFSQGAFSFHWTGDNNADWSFFQTSISEIFNFQLFGIPFVGVDLCGFGGNTTEELCSRWMQAGAFFPFSRNHNQIYMIPQEPYAWGTNSTVYQASRTSLKLRYSLLKWYYSIFARNNGTGSVFRPLFFDYQETDVLTIEDQFLLGSELMFAPVVQPNTTFRNVLFPGNQIFWFDFFDVTKIYLSGTIVNISNYLNSTPPIFQKDGTIIYMQNSDNVKTVKDLDNQFTLKIALRRNTNGNFTASGIMMAIENYTNSNDVNQFCMGQSDCLLNIQANGYLVGSNKLNLTISFSKYSQQSNVQQNYVAKLDIVGIIRVDGTYSNYTETLSQTVLCSDGTTINRLI